MRMVVTLVVLLASVAVIMLPNVFPDSTQKWALGAVSTLLGYWLRGS